MELSRKTALITGATSGIGEVVASHLAQAGIARLIVCGRREERLHTVKKRLSSDFGTDVHTITLDVRDRAAVLEALREEALPESFRRIDLLINNAGLAAGLDPFGDASIDDFERMIDTNVKGLLYVSKAVVPIMIRQRSGHIINVSSIAGKEVYGCGHVYCATKHAVDALTRGMRLDLSQYGIKVSQVAPGAVNTEFSTVRFHGDKARADQVYEGYQPLTAADIADCILFMVTTPEHVNIADMTIFPKAQASSSLIHKQHNL